MKRIYMFILIICLISISCDESLSPNGKFNERYILSGILTPNGNTQLINLSYSYVSEIDDIIVNKPITDAELNVWFDDEIRIFNPITIDVSDTLVSDGKLEVFSNDNFSIEAGKTYDIEALMNNGRRIKGTTTVPEKLDLMIFPTDRKVNPDSKNEIALRWEYDESNYNYRVVRAYLKYERPINGEIQKFKVQIPEKYLEVNGKSVPYYHKPSRVGNFVLSNKIIDDLLKTLGDGVVKKHEIVIKYITIEILSYDKHLTKYYESIRDDQVGGIVTVDKSGYSNIEGGEGIFASYFRQETSFFFDFEYIFKLGYTPTDVIE